MGTKVTEVIVPAASSTGIGNFGSYYNFLQHTVRVTVEIWEPERDLDLNYIPKGWNPDD